MSRPCPICDNNMRGDIRAWAAQGNGPTKMREKLSKLGLTVSVRSIGYHIKMHDPDAGSLTIVKKAAVRAKETYEAKVEEIGKELDNVKTIGEKFEGILNVLLDAGEHLTAEKVASLPPQTLIKMIATGSDLLLKAKKLEIEERKAQSTLNFDISDIGKLLSKVSTKKRK